MLAEVSEIFQEGFKMPFSYLVNPEKRIHYFYLVSSLLLAYYVYRKSKVKGSYLRYLFHKKVWMSPSAVIDYGLFFFNSFIKVILVAPYLIFGFYFAFYIEEWLGFFFGLPDTSLTKLQVIIFYTISLTLLNDFFSYIVHFMMHRVSFLWEFHKVHHSATVLNPITQYRLHPIELLLNNAKGIFVFALVTGFFDYLSPEKISKLTYLGANVFSMFFLFLGANLRHSHVKLSFFQPIETIFLSPFQHQIHHSANPAHFNKNLGSKLAVWDRLFGTLIRSQQIKGNLRFGLGTEENGHYSSFWKNLYQPFLRIPFLLFSSLKNRGQ